MLPRYATDRNHMKKYKKEGHKWIIQGWMKLANNLGGRVLRRTTNDIQHTLNNHNSSP